MTNFVKQRYQYFVDLQTSASEIQVINMTAGGLMPQARLKPFFAAFKHFKLGRVRYKFVPAATLPVDPTGLSYEVGENTVDPRDQMNPGLVRITNGEDVNYLLDELTGEDAERIYYATMLDPRWYKFQLQRGFKRTAKPLLWNVGQTHQSISQVMVGRQATGTMAVAGGQNTVPPMAAALGNAAETPEMSVQKLQDAFDDTESLWNWQDAMLMQTGRVRMGWMPTDMCDSGLYGPNAVPEVNLVTVILPKAYKTVYYYRLYIEEEVLFKDPVAMLPIYHVGPGASAGVGGYINWAAADRYIVPAGNVPSTGSGKGDPDDIASQGTNKVNGGYDI